MADFVKSPLKVNLAYYTRVLAVGQTSNNTSFHIFTSVQMSLPTQIIVCGLLYYILIRMAKVEKANIKR